MADHVTRRADPCRRHPDELAEAAQHQHDQALRRHARGLAVTYQRAADQIVPQLEYATIKQDTGVGGADV